VLKKWVYRVFMKHLSDSEVLSKTRELALQEQALSLQLLENLLEVDDRRLFAKVGYESLHCCPVRGIA